ncbi:uncharacterized protein VNE69_04179 [Vairimorpha necatrix]|uniref:Uncharacterized protein n=1 Tax=Vairimorpha necatrix TaxID=6039 RepID=A0AAX4JBI9_9MICR
MIFFKILIMLIKLSCASNSQFLTKDVILNKIDYSDYKIFNHNDAYCKVTLSYNGAYCIFSAIIGEITGYFEIPLSNENDETKDGYRNLETIASDIEKKMFEIDININNYCILLIYKQNDIENFSIMNDIIHYIKKINSEKKIKTEIYYDFILEDDCIMKRTIIDRNNIRSKNNKTGRFEISMVSYKIKKDSLNFTIEIFQNDIKLFDYIPKLMTVLETNKSNHYATIETKIVGINKIKNEKPEFEINIKNNKINIRQEKVTYFYSYKDNQNSKKNIAISRDCFVRFGEILHFLYENKKDCFECINLFYKFLEINNFVKIFINKIIKNENSALNILFKHICAIFNEKLINNTGAINKNLIGNRAEKNKLTKKIVKYLRGNDAFSFTGLMIKTCLFLEGDIYIRNNTKIENTILKPFNEIRNIILIDVLSIRSPIKRKNTIRKNIPYLLKICREVYDGLKDINQYNDRSAKYYNAIFKFFQEIENGINEIEEDRKDSYREKKIKEFMKLNFNQCEAINEIKEKLEKITKQNIIDKRSNISRSLYEKRFTSSERNSTENSLDYDYNKTI